MRDEARPGRAGRLFVGGTLVLALLSGTDVAKSQGSVLSPEERSARFRECGVDPDSHLEPLETSEDLIDTASRIAGDGHPRERLGRLQRFLFDEERFDFDYESRATLTAKQVFEVRHGNCVSFTNLFVAMGRAVGIPVRLASVSLVEDEERRGDLIIVSSHVVAAYRDGGDVLVYDFDRRREGMPLGIEIRDDLWIDAIYLNNRGVEALVEEEFDAANRFLEDTVRLVPDFAEAWGNLGVARRRARDIGGAFDAYLIALQIEPHDVGIRTNIAKLYGTLVADGRSFETGGGDRTPGDVPSDYREWLIEGDHAMSKGLLQSGLESYRSAHRLAPERPEPLVAMARAKLYLGKPRHAGKLVARALEIAPDDPEATHLDAAIRRAGYN